MNAYVVVTDRHSAKYLVAMCAPSVVRTMIRKRAMDIHAIAKLAPSEVMAMIAGDSASSPTDLQADAATQIATITPEKLLALVASAKRPIVDVRTAGEYAAAHIPGALSLPLFTDEERAAVGTLYVQTNKAAAIEWGWQRVSSRLQSYIDAGRACAVDNQLIIHCARGGLRSRSLAWLLSQSGLQVSVIDGGYKTFRRQVLTQFEQTFSICILSGQTGSGKTEVLRHLAEMNEQVIDLERLANHKGSAFGALGEPVQPRTEQFENMLAVALATKNPHRRLWLEDESARIGSCVIPQALWQQMRAATVIKLEIPSDERCRYSLQVYGQHAPALLRDAIVRVQKRLGGLRTKQATAAIDVGDLDTAADIMLGYYDAGYAHGLSLRNQELISVVESATTNAETNAVLVRDEANRRVVAL
jgi:tRNA 2-selenouridine synthase